MAMAAVRRRARRLHVDSRRDFERTHGDGRRRRLPASRACASDQRVRLRRGTVNPDGHRDRGAIGADSFAHPVAEPQPVTGPCPEPVTQPRPITGAGPEPRPWSGRFGRRGARADARHERSPASHHASHRRAQSNPAAPLLLRPFPIVRIKGGLTRTGARVTLLTVRAPRGARIAIRCRGRSCPVPRLARTATLTRFRTLERNLAAGTRIDVTVTRPDRIGKWTTIHIARGAPPTRRDRCVLPGARSPVPCPIG